MEDFCKIKIHNDTNSDTLYLDSLEKVGVVKSLYDRMIKISEYCSTDRNSKVTAQLLYHINGYNDFSKIIKRYLYDPNTEITINILNGVLICKCCKGKLTIIQNRGK